MVKVLPVGSLTGTPLEGFGEMPGLAVRKKTGWPAGFGFARCGNARFGSSNRFGGIYQKRVTGYNSHGRSSTSKRKTYYVKMRQYRPTNPQTVAQQANRQKMTDANLAWEALTESQQTVYNFAGKRLNRVGRRIFIGEYIKSH